VGFNLEAEVVLKMLPNVKQATIAPLLKASIVPGTLIYTDEYIIYSPLSQWGMTIKVSVTAGRWLTINQISGFMTYYSH